MSEPNEDQPGHRDYPPPDPAMRQNPSPAPASPPPPPVQPAYAYPPAPAETGKKKRTGAGLGFAIVIVFVIYLCTKLFGAGDPNYTVLRTSLDIDSTTDVWVSSGDDLQDSDYEKITGKLWAQYDRVHVTFLCSSPTTRQRAIVSQSSVGNYSGRIFVRGKC